MGTRWRGLLAPINAPTGDGRRMAVRAFTHRPLPLALKWQRTDDQGHDASVVIGLMDVCNIDEDAGEVWGEGELFDDQPHLPRLSEDVAEAILLTTKGVIGPSVDAGSAQGMVVETGTDVPLTEERADQLWQEAQDAGTEPNIEVLFTAYEIAAATLVVIPAFVEARPFELIAAVEDAPATKPAPAALVASLTAAAPSIPAEVFDNPEFGAFQNITVEDRGEGFLRVAGYVAAFDMCHVGVRDVCLTAPASAIDYAPFHRYTFDVVGGDDQLISVGRITTGFGKTGTGCTCCRGKDDHACDDFGLAQTIAHYDAMATIAHGRCGSDERGIWFAGVADPNLSAAGRTALNRRRFSGDWRDFGGNLELVEILALAREREGFPIPTVAIRNGRQMSLTAAGIIRPDQPRPVDAIDLGALARHVASLVVTELRQPAAVTAAAAPVHTAAMVALRMTEESAARLAVDGGEPAAELHATRAYLGEAADWSPEDQAALIDAMSVVAAGLAPLDANGFALSLFNPDEEGAGAVVLGLEGEAIATAQTTVMTALEPFASHIPAQHQPHVEHVTLQYTDDPARLADLVDLVGPAVSFDRLRVAFGDTVTDLPLGGQAQEPSAAATLAAEIEATVAAVDPEVRNRAKTATALLTELEDTHVVLRR